MVIASCYNLDMASGMQAYEKIVKVPIDDDALYERLTNAMSYLEKLAAPDSLVMSEFDTKNKNRQELMYLYQKAEALPADSVGTNALKMYIADALYDMGNYEDVDKIAKYVLSRNPRDARALNLLAAVKRNEGKYDEGLMYCNKILEINHEDLGAIAQKARIELKRKHDQQAANYVQEGLRIDPDDDLVLEAKAMVDHYAGRKNESMASLATIKRHESYSGDSTISSRLAPILNGSVIYR